MVLHFCASVLHFVHVVSSLLSRPLFISVVSFQASISPLLHSFDSCLCRTSPHPVLTLVHFHFVSFRRFRRGACLFNWLLSTAGFLISAAFVHCRPCMSAFFIFTVGFRFRLVSFRRLSPVSTFISSSSFSRLLGFTSSSRFLVHIVFSRRSCGFHLAWAQSTKARRDLEMGFDPGILC